MKNSLLITTLMLGASVATMAKATCTQTCGDNCCWDLEDGVLSISGRGPMTEFASTKDIPWYNQKASITSVQVSNGITSIGNRAFAYATSLTSITIPDSVTSIGDFAFQGARSLTSITIPNSVTSIGNNAFEKATSLTSITIPDSVTSIGDHAFQDASRLTSITIPEGVTSIGDYAFQDASSLTSITIPDSVTSIGDSAFAYATSLTSITIPDSVTSIGYSAFRDASSLTSITIPDTAALQVSSTGKGPFYNLDLSNITIHCAGVLEQCKANMLAAGYEDGTYNMVQAPYSKKQADGSRAYYDANGKLTGFTGKRIYTVEEASAVSKDTSNTIKLRYK